MSVGGFRGKGSSAAKPRNDRLEKDATPERRLSEMAFLSNLPSHAVRRLPSPQKNRQNSAKNPRPQKTFAFQKPKFQVY